jgi:predicted RNase H-like nuclease (RuvC/YqgF family)
MTKDRNYYRQCDNATILVLAKEGGDELSMVLAERLADALFDLDLEHADRNEIADLNAEVNDLKEEIAEANQTIRYLESELENVK